VELHRPVELLPLVALQDPDLSKNNTTKRKNEQTWTGQKREWYVHVTQGSQASLY
jgi:hypothetical protein